MTIIRNSKKVKLQSDCNEINARSVAAGIVSLWSLTLPSPIVSLRNTAFTQCVRKLATVVQVIHKANVSISCRIRALARNLIWERVQYGDGRTLVFGGVNWKDWLKTDDFLIYFFVIISWAGVWTRKPPLTTALCRIYGDIGDDAAWYATIYAAEAGSCCIWAEMQSRAALL